MTGHRKHRRGRKSVPGSPSDRALGLIAGLLWLTTLAGCGGGSPNQTAPPSVSNPTPLITSLSPAAIIAGSAAANVTINGTGFIATSIVDVNGSPVQSTFSNASQLVAALPASALANASVASVTVTNPAPGGGASSAAKLAINNPLPAVTSVTPASILAGAAAQTIDIIGTGFVAVSAVQWNGSALQTSFASGTEIKATVPAQDLAAGQVAHLSIANPAPGGGDSASASFNVTSPTPVVTSISPKTAPADAAVVVTITGSGFELNSVAEWNGSPRPTTFVLPTSLQIALSASDLKTPGTGQIVVNNPGPGGSAAPPIPLAILSPAPIITAVNPPSTLVNPSAATPLQITIAGSNFAPNATVSASSQALTVVSQTTTSIVAAIPPTSLAAAGALTLVVTNPGANPVPSNPYVFNVVAVPGILSITPISAAIGSQDLTLTLSASGLLPDSVVQWNGTPLATKTVTTTPFGSGTPILSGLTAVLPAADLSIFTTGSITVASPENAAAVSPPMAFSTYLALLNNALLYNQHDGMLYASVPGIAGPGLGNSVVAFDPLTGVITRTIPVGSEPTQLTISDDGTQMFVGLDGADAVRQVNLITGVAGLQFSLGNGGGIYGTPFIPEAVAALPGEPNSVAVYNSSAFVTIYDSGAARPNTAPLNGYFNQNIGSIAFGPSAATLYTTQSPLVGDDFGVLTIDSTGVSAINGLPSPLPYPYSGSLQFDAGRLYLSNGAVLNATTAAQLGQFFLSPSVPSTGPIVSDSALQKAWMVPAAPLPSSFPDNQVLAFDETTFNQTGSIVVNGNSTTGSAIGALGLVRWGQNGLAFTTLNQIYVLHSPVVKDLSSSPADLAVTIHAPATATTGGPINYSIVVTNNGPNPAQGVNLSATLADSISNQSVTTNVGTCSGGVFCNLGTLAGGAAATIQVAGTVLNSGSVESTATVASVSYDPVQTNNVVSAVTTVSGPTYAALPTMATVLPNLILAGSTTTTLTVNGTGFDPASSVLWNGKPIPTTYVSGTQLTAFLDAAFITTLGWGQVTVSNPMPGGGQSSGANVSIYQALNVPASGLTYDPFTRKLYAAVPAVATNLVGNSLVAIDPATGTIGTPIPVGNGPGVMAESGDGNYLYLGLSGDKTFAQFNLLTQSLGTTYPIVVPGYGNLPAFGLAVQPGTDTTLAIDTNSNGIGIFDIAGTTGTFRPNFSGVYNGGGPAFADATHLYAESSNTATEPFYRYTVDANGLTLIDLTALNGLGGTGFGFTIGQDGLVYGDNGGILNPLPTPPSQVALLPLSPPSNPGYFLSGDAEVPDTPQHKIFLVGDNAAGTFTAVLERFDTTNYVNEEQYQLPVPEGLPLEGYQLVRWGQDGLALRAYDSVGGSLAGYQLLLFRGPFVLPAEAAINPIPALSAVTPGSLTHDSGNQYVTAVGSGFIPGAVVLWNGTPRTTTYIDHNHLQFAVAAADVAAPSSVSLSAANPGSTPSPILPLTVQ